MHNDADDIFSHVADSTTRCPSAYSFRHIDKEGAMCYIPKGYGQLSGPNEGKPRVGDFGSWHCGKTSGSEVSAFPVPFT